MSEQPDNPWGRPIHVPPAGPPQNIRPSQEIYPRMGLENVQRMCSDLYRKLGVSAIRDLFPEGEEALEAASKKQALFLAGVLGGPPLYAQFIGPPRMRARHMPFVIDEPARREWLRCFFEVLEDADRYDFPPEHLEGFRTFLEGFSAWMVNKA